MGNDVNYGSLPLGSYAAYSSASVEPTSVFGSAVYSYPPASSTSSVKIGDPPTSGLSTGVQAAIGAGVGVIALLAIGATIYFVRQQRAKQSVQRSSPPAYDEISGPPGGARPEMQGGVKHYELYQPQVVHEMAGAKQAQEMSAARDGYAMSPSGPRYELH
ncbi:hypothetical protein LTR09_010590 [Extremus antarcticus]|uniref:Uncharacterized protein n=1 Tax=Extremus antarcticus TaxID=702011 RepID=A0AAJ0D7H2_9PEZI|nr:hypothetical protein LTR09_010590 [Extremus antarcticus]